MITGLRSATYDHLQLNAGLFLLGFDWSNANTAEALKAAIDAFVTEGEGVIGATRGGGTFQATPAMRNIEADGLRAPHKRGTVNDGWTVKLTGTMLEFTAENMARALATTTVTTESGVKKIRLRTKIEESDYIPKLCWIGDTSKGFALIEIENALNVNGATFTFTDKGEGTLPFEFQAHQEDVLAQEEAPCTILYFE